MDQRSRRPGGASEDIPGDAVGLGAEFLGETLFEIDQMPVAVAGDGQAVVGVGDDLGAAVLGVGAHLEDVQGDQVADHLAHRLPGDAGAGGHVRGPVDARYLHTTYLLDRACTRVVNRPDGIRAVHEKLVALRFPELCPPTHVGVTI